ncbi:Uncharacterised protein [Mycobacteroides abscessus subsp. abscessus]|nr:Uncharacterised protein [Mycobacteroides abscessus subsp. abscessus]
MLPNGAGMTVFIASTIPPPDPDMADPAMFANSAPPSPRRGEPSELLRRPPKNFRSVEPAWTNPHWVGSENPGGKRDSLSPPIPMSARPPKSGKISEIPSMILAYGLLPPPKPPEPFESSAPRSSFACCRSRLSLSTWSRLRSLVVSFVLGLDSRSASSFSVTSRRLDRSVMRSSASRICLGDAPPPDEPEVLPSAWAATDPPEGSEMLLVGSPTAAAFEPRPEPNITCTWSMWF